MCVCLRAKSCQLQWQLIKLVENRYAEKIVCCLYEKKTLEPTNTAQPRHIRSCMLPYFCREFFICQNATNTIHHLVSLSRFQKWQAYDFNLGHCSFWMQNLNDEQITSSLLPPILYVIKNCNLKIDYSPIEYRNYIVQNPISESSHITSSVYIPT